MRPLAVVAPGSSADIAAPAQVIISLDAAKFGAWEGAEFAPEATFLKALGEIDGIKRIETQTFTLMPM